MWQSDNGYYDLHTLWTSLTNNLYVSILLTLLITAAFRLSLIRLSQVFLCISRKMALDCSILLSSYYHLRPGNL